MACELCRRSKVKINSVNIQYNEALQKLAKNIRGEYNPNQKNQILLICEQCEENVMKQYKSELIEDSFQDNTESKEAIIINEEEIKPKIEKDPLADDVIVQRQELHSEENNCYTKDNKSTVDNTGIIKEEEMEYSLTNEVEIQENILDSGEQQTGTDSSVQVFDIIVKEEPRFHEDDHVMPENMEDINDNSTSEHCTMSINKGKTKEQLLIEKRKAEKKRYSKIKDDPVKYEEQKQKERLKYLKKKDKKLVKPIAEMTLQEKHVKRKIWKENSKNYRENKKKKEIVVKKFLRDQFTFISNADNKSNPPDSEARSSHQQVEEQTSRESL